MIDCDKMIDDHDGKCTCYNFDKKPLVYDYQPGFIKELNYHRIGVPVL